MVDELKRSMRQGRCSLNWNLTGILSLSLFVSVSFCLSVSVSLSPFKLNSWSVSWKTWITIYYQIRCEIMKLLHGAFLLVFILKLKKDVLHWRLVLIGWWLGRSLCDFLSSVVRCFTCCPACFRKFPQYVWKWIGAATHCQSARFSDPHPRQQRKHKSNLAARNHRNHEQHPGYNHPNAGELL